MKWVQNLKKPIILQAPLDGISDFVFRSMLLEKEYTPSILFTEFTSLKEIILKSETSKLRLSHPKSNLPIIAQIWGKDPKDYYIGAKILSKMDFWGIDINMGCPSEKIVKKKACSALINDKVKAKKCIEATREGINKNMTLSVKTRIGFEKIQLDWAEFLLDQDLDFLTFHGRTRKQKSYGMADWNIIKQIAVMKNEKQIKTLLFGNGDIESKSQAIQYTKKYLLDGVMVGRALIKNPYFFEEKNFYEISKIKILKHIEKYTLNFDKFYNKRKNFEEMKRMFKHNLKNFEREEVLSILTKIEYKDFLDSIQNLLKKYEN